MPTDTIMMLRGNNGSVAQMPLELKKTFCFALLFHFVNQIIN